MDGLFYAKAAAFISAAFAIAIGVTGPSISQGLIAARAVDNMGKYPESAGKIRTAAFLSMGFVETCAIYALMIAGALLYAASRI